MLPKLFIAWASETKTLVATTFGLHPLVELRDDTVPIIHGQTITAKLLVLVAMHAIQQIEYTERDVPRSFFAPWHFIDDPGVHPFGLRGTGRAFDPEKGLGI